MPIKVWEEVNVRMERQLLRWLQGLLLVADGNVRKIGKTDAKAIIKQGSWLRRSRAARKGARNRRRRLAAGRFDFA